jgi:hypothetical protein
MYLHVFVNIYKLAAFNPVKNIKYNYCMKCSLTKTLVKCLFTQHWFLKQGSKNIKQDIISR